MYSFPFFFPTSKHKYYPKWFFRRTWGYTIYYHLMRILKNASEISTHDFTTLKYNFFSINIFVYNLSASGCANGETFRLGNTLIFLDEECRKLLLLLDLFSRAGKWRRVENKVTSSLPHFTISLSLSLIRSGSYSTLELFCLIPHTLRASFPFRIPRKATPGRPVCANLPVLAAEASHPATWERRCS